MGYRSQVAFVICGPKDIMVAQLTTYRLTYEHPEHTKEALDACTYKIDTSNDELTIRFHAEDTKWYEPYEDVAALTALFDEFREAAEEDNSKINGAFLRIGEDDNDIVCDRYGGEPYDLLHLNRAIEINCYPGVSLAEALGMETV